MTIPIYQPYFTKESMKYAHDAIDSGWLSSIGPYKQKTTEWLQNYLGVKHVLLTGNGTEACHLTAKALQLRYPERHNLIIPNNVYVAAWNAFLYDPGFLLGPIDANYDTWNFDWKKYTEKHESRINHWSAAIVVVHNLGNIVNVPEIQRTFPEIPVIEDACETFGGEYEGMKAGTAALCASLSFFGNKTVTSGEGGAFITNDDEIYDAALRWHGQGMSDRRYVHDRLGYNYRMTNVQAAILYGQLELLPEIMEKKNHIWQYYQNNIKAVTFQKEEPNTKHAHWMFGVCVSGNKSYEDVKVFFDAAEIETRPMFYPITEHKYLEKIRADVRISEQLAKECFMIPCYPLLTDEELKYIAGKVNEYGLQTI